MDQPYGECCKTVITDLDPTTLKCFGVWKQTPTILFFGITWKTFSSILL